ncbi:uncharacterized protein [Procambarus clarkii]|uniref:uncharacterized protein isoform X2 n=1 Tax=Procambarus clarkii TaxID=6728 RepID=UPI001E6776A5|nr:uncharacterized protein LOC123766909 isoform X2 [Procambarus clarkii]
MESTVVMETEEYEDVPEEVVETSYMCGECFLLFPTTEDFNAHECHGTEVKRPEHRDKQRKDEKPHTSLHTANPRTSARTDVVETESEAAMEEAVASILGERMKRKAPPKNISDMQFDRTLVVPAEHSIEHTGIIDQEMESVVEHTVESTDHSDGSMMMEGVEIPSANVYMYDNPAYLNRLMKDNTFGRRVRHDAPYSHRLGPWDNKCSRLLIQLLKEYPKAYFILDKECKRTEAWEMIRVKLAEAGYQFTVLQIRMRWRELCKKYRNTINHNDLYNSRKTCQYFDDLNNLFGVWDCPATLLLIRQLEANGSKRLGQNGGTRMRHRVWEHIRQFLQSHGYQYTADQVQGRWSTLVTLYQRMIEHNSKPHNERIVIAFKDHIERVFKYVPERNSKWLKIMEKRGKKPKELKKKWSIPIERQLLKYYHERVYRFNNDYVNNSALWEEIVEKLEREIGYETTVDKVRTRFYELTKQFSLMEQHNAQPGTIRRECRHHEHLAEIYNIYNYWPHDRSTIKLEKSSTIRMRQVHSQLAWNEDESRLLLQLYPQILVAHLSSGEHQPMEELWLQLAKSYLNAQNDRKQCYEIEDHIALLRRGYHSPNPFPFVVEMQLLEETEMTLGFTPEPLPVEADQLVPYWSHSAANLLLDFVMHHRQEGVKNSSLFEMISRDLAGCGYRYTGEECRLYYSLLRQLYTNRMRTIKRNRELLKPFPYMDKMAEVDSVVSHPKFVESEETRKMILSTACSRLEAIMDGCDDARRDFMVNWLTNLKMCIKRSALIHPPPPVKYLARILAETIEDSSVEGEYKQFDSILGPHLDLLNSIAERGGSSLMYQPTIFKNKGKKIVTNKTVQTKYGTVHWTEANHIIMLNTVKEWRLLCHDSAEFEGVLISEELWKEVASRLSTHYKVDPNKCQERFSQLCREYKSVVSFNARIGLEEATKTVVCKELVESILIPFICHDADFDIRDEWWASEEGGDWSRGETLELLFTVRELWQGQVKIDWDMVSMMMNASGYPRHDECCRNRFQQLYNGYLAASEHNKNCSIRTRRRPPFYFKMKSLFDFSETNHTFDPEPLGGQEIEMDENKVLEVLVRGLSIIKGNFCHSVPRRPLLVALSKYLNDHFCLTTPAFPPHQIWYLMVKLHHIHQDDEYDNTIVPNEINLHDQWQNHSLPMVAYGLLAVPLPGWQSVCDWSVEEVYLLTETAINWELQPRNLQSVGKTMAIVASEVLRSNGFEKTSLRCQDQWQYLVATFKHGGYKQLTEQINLLYLLAPCMLDPQPSYLYPTVRVSKNTEQQQDCQTNKFKLPVQATKPQKIQTKVPPQLVNKEQTPKVSSRKLEINEKNVAELADCKLNLQETKSKSAPGNVVSYVQINVLQQSVPKKRHVQVSTDEIREWEVEEVVSSTMIDMKEESNFVDSTGTSLDKNSPKSTEVEEQVSDRDQDRFTSATEIKSSNSSPSNKITYILQCDSDSQEDKVKVEIISIKEGKRTKLIECRTVKGIVPSRLLKLYYPANFVIPSGLKHMYIPRILVHPDIVTAKKKMKVSHSRDKPALPKSKTTFNPSVLQAPYLNIKTESEEIQFGESGFDEPDDSNIQFDSNDDQSEESKRGGIMKLLEQYSQQCREEKTRLLNTLQESHQQQTLVLKQILNVFQNLQNIL